MQRDGAVPVESVFLKTVTRRQGELIGLLAFLPGVGSELESDGGSCAPRPAYLRSGRPIRLPEKRGQGCYLLVVFLVSAVS